MFDFNSLGESLYDTQSLEDKKELIKNVPIYEQSGKKEVVVKGGKYINVNTGRVESRTRDELQVMTITYNPNNYSGETITLSNSLFKGTLPLNDVMVVGGTQPRNITVYLPQDYIIPKLVRQGGSYTKYKKSMKNKRKTKKHKSRRYRKIK